MFTNHEEFLQWKAKEERGTCISSYTKPKECNSRATCKYIVLYMYTFITSVNIDSLLLFRKCTHAAMMVKAGRTVDKKTEQKRKHRGSWKLV